MGISEQVLATIDDAVTRAGATQQELAAIEAANGHKLAERQEIETRTIGEILSTAAFLAQQPISDSEGVQHTSGWIDVGVLEQRPYLEGRINVKSLSDDSGIRTANVYLRVIDTRTGGTVPLINSSPDYEVLSCGRRRLDVDMISPAYPGSDNWSDAEGYLDLLRKAQAAKLTEHSGKHTSLMDSIDAYLHDVVDTTDIAPDPDNSNGLEVNSYTLPDVDVSDIGENKRLKYRTTITPRITGGDATRSTGIWSNSCELVVKEEDGTVVDVITITQNGVRMRSPTTWGCHAITPDNPKWAEVEQYVLAMQEAE